MSARVAKLCDCKACRSRRAKARNRCQFVIDPDATIDDVPHRVVVCGRRECTEHPSSQEAPKA